MIDKEKFRDNFKYYDKGIVLQVIDMFLAGYPDRLKELQANINTMDFVKIDHNAHSLKGEVAYMSSEVSELARVMEHKGKDKDGNGLQDTFDKLRSGTLILAGELNQMRTEYK